MYKLRLLKYTNRTAAVTNWLEILDILKVVTQLGYL